MLMIYKTDNSFVIEAAILLSKGSANPSKLCNSFNSARKRVEP